MLFGSVGFTSQPLLRSGDRHLSVDNAMSPATPKGGGAFSSLSTPSGQPRGSSAHRIVFGPTRRRRAWRRE